MIYIKTFIKEFFNTLRWYFDSSTIGSLLCQIIFNTVIATILLIQGNVLLGAAFISGLFTAIANYVSNTRERNFIWLIIGLISTLITLGTLGAYFFIYVI